MKGKIIKVIRDKRFGFIQASNGAEYFFHQTNLNGFWDDLAKDFEKGIEIPVTFEPTESLKGLRADKVTRLDFPNQSGVEEENDSKRTPDKTRRVR